MTTEASQSAALHRPEPDRPLHPARDLICTASLLNFEPGLYAVEFRADCDARSDIGLHVPCARVELVTPPGSTARGIVLTGAGDAWLTRQTASASLLVVGGRLGAVLTIYRYSDQVHSPEVQFRQIHAAPASTAAAGASLGDTLAAGHPAALTLVVHSADGHVHSRNDGEWAGGQGQPIEGFSISLPAGFSPSDLEYQALLGLNWRTPWFAAGTFCGSQGMGLPLLGFRLRLAGAAADRFDCRSWGLFEPGVSVGPIGGGQDCDGQKQSLTAMRVQLWPKQASGGDALAVSAEPPA